MTSKIFKIFSITVLAVFIIGVIALAFPAGVSAQAPQPPAKGSPERDGKGQAGRRLEWAFKLTEHRLREQAFLFKRMDQSVKRAEQLIKQLQGKSVNTKELEAALATFQTKKADAFKLHEAAQAILKEHKGFDNNGKVADPAQARETLKAANEKMTAARKQGGEAFRAFEKVMREFLQTNKPKENK